MGRRGAAALVCLVLLGTAAGCGDGDDVETVAEPTTTTIDPFAPTTSTSAVPRTTPFTFPPKDTTPFSPGEGTFTISGDQQAMGTFSMASCPRITVTGNRGVVASLVFVTNPNLASARRWTLELAGMSPGETNFPEPGGFNQLPPRRVRLSVEILSQILTWGTTAAGEGTVTGKLTTKVPNAKSGSFELELGFTGSEGNTVPLDSHRPVTIKGGWSCPDS